MDFVIRPLTAADEPILWEMLYQAGRAGDSGFVAHDANEGEFLGAVWFRLPTGGHKGRGDEEKVTPELAFAVKPGHRRRGIGAALLTQLVKVNPQHSAISIRASTKNPAVRLYERFGFKIVRQSAESVTMRRDA